MFKAMKKSSEKIVTIFSVERRIGDTYFLLFNKSSKRWEWHEASGFTPLD